MDAIDITDSAFSLGIPDVNNVISVGGGFQDYTMFIYIGAAILVAFIGMFIYKFYMNKRVNDNQELDCEGGFCTMGDKPPSTSHI
jgi:hypothetical protein